MPSDRLNRINTQVVNIAARRIGGLSRSARTKVLHYVAGTSAMYNLYARHCREFPDACLGATKSAINSKLSTELQRYYNISAFETGGILKGIPPDAISQKTGMPKNEVERHWSQHHWFCEQQIAPRSLQYCYEVPSMYVSNAAEKNESAFHRLQTYHFASVRSCVDVALRVLTRVGWTPGFSNPDSLNAQEAVPTEYTYRHLISGKGDDGGSPSRMNRWKNQRGENAICARRSGDAGWCWHQHICHH